MSFRAKLARTGHKRLLALDGGGIRGAMTLEVLLKIETLLRTDAKNDRLVLADHFDYIAGTSTGAIIGTCLALGWDVGRILTFYEQCGSEMFDKASLLKRLQYKFNDEPLAKRLRAEIGCEANGSDRTLGTDALQTLLMVVLRNATTDSPWPVSNNPGALFNRQRNEDGTPFGPCNLDVPLWQLVRASTAAPTYFPPEIVTVGGETFVFVDGGVTMYNNPAFQLFLMATVEPFNLCWEAGEDKMLLVSIGTGTGPGENASLRPDQMNLLYNASSIPSALMFAALNEQDFLCRVFGRCQTGPKLDLEIGDMIERGGGPVKPKLFRYSRYNAELSARGLAALGLSGLEPADVQQMDSVAHVEELRLVGRKVAETVKLEHIK
jgi:predicted acylesterase/phospholipase RssA